MLRVVCLTDGDQPAGEPLGVCVCAGGGPEFFCSEAILLAYAKMVAAGILIEVGR